MNCAMKTTARAGPDILMFQSPSPIKTPVLKPRSKRAAMATAPDFARISPAYLEAVNRFYGSGHAAAVKIAGHAIDIQPVWPPAAQSTSTRVLALEIDGAKAQLELPTAVVELLLRQADPDVDLARLAPAHAALLLEALLAPELAWLEAQTGSSIEFVTTDSKPGAGEPLPLLVAMEDASFGCVLRFQTPGHALQLANLFQANAGTTPAVPDDLPLPVALWGGVVELALAELRGLAIGDVVLLDDAGATALLTIGNRLVAAVSITPAGVQFDTTPKPFNATPWNWIMTEKPADAAEIVDASAVDDLPVTLVFELGRTSLPVGEVKQLVAGAVVQLPAATQQTVSILANGKRVGRGEIVQIGEAFGVRVLGMFENA